MKKTLLILILFCFTLVSCVKEQGQIVPAADPSASDGADPYAGLTYHDVYDPKTDFDNRFGRGQGRMIETDDICYFISRGIAYYSDKVTGEYDVLCGKPECLHDSENCNGWLGGFDDSLIYYNGLLYYAAQIRDKDNRLKNMMCCTNADGTEHRTLFEFNCDQCYIPNELVMHRGRLYGKSCSAKVVDGEPLNFCSISCWDIETGEHSVIFEKEGYCSTTIPQTFFFGRYIYICFDNIVSVEDVEDSIHVYVDIYRWDIEEENLETIFSSGKETFPGSYYTIWVEATDRIFIGALNPDSRKPAESAPVYCISDGEAFKIAESEELLPIKLLDGAIMWETLDDATNTLRIILRDYDGNEFYNGDLDISFLRDYGSLGVSAVYGNSSEFYFVLKPFRQGGRFIVVRCDLKDGEITASVICVTA